jgi:phosphoribosylaminoimidazole-succinocarboxamide synthase
MTNFRYTPAFSNLDPFHQGKSRDTFTIPPAYDKTGDADDKLVVVATKRISTHNMVHQSQIPCKDEVLTALTIFWLTDVFEKAGIPHHLLTYGARIYDYLPGRKAGNVSDAHYRTIIVRRLKIIPIEFIFRKYLAGSLYRDFYSKGLPNPYGVTLPRGLELMSAFDEPIFTPTEKSDMDRPINAGITRSQHSKAVELTSKALNLAREHLCPLGIEVVDSKLEAGHDRLGNLYLGDEIVTPDSSRFCESARIKLGEEPPWLDKQIARDEAERIWGNGPREPLTFSPKIVSKLTDTNLSIFHGITGQSLEEFQHTRLD